MKATGRLTGDVDKLAKIVKEAKAGDPGSLGEIEAVKRWIDEGSTVEVPTEHQNQVLESGESRKNPDYRVDGTTREVKSRSEALDSNWAKRSVTTANAQMKNSGFQEQGEAELQLRGPEAQTATLDQIERQVKGSFNAERGRSLRRVAVYKDGALAGEWVRLADGSVVRTFPGGTP